MDLEGILAGLDPFGEPYDGLLGAGLLSHYGAVIDFGRDELRLRRPTCDPRLEGDWVGTAIWHKGARHDGPNEAGYHFAFRDGSLAIRHNDFRLEYPFVVTDNSCRPNQIDLTTIRATMAMGVYRFEGEKLWIALPFLQVDDYSKRPESLTNTESCRFTTLLLRRAVSADD